MAFSTDDLSAVDAAIARGEQRVTYADRTVEYRTVEDLLKAKRLIEAELAQDGIAFVRTRPVKGMGFA